MTLSYEETERLAIQRMELNRRIKAVLIERLGLDMSLDHLTDDQSLFGRGLGLDSIDALELVVGVEDMFNVSIYDGDMEVFGSVNKLADYIIDQLGGVPVL